MGELDQFNKTGLKAIVEAAAAKSHEPGSVEQKVGDFYAAAMNTAAINAAGLKPVEADLGLVAGIASPADFALVLAALHNLGIDAVFTVSVGADQKRSDLNVLYARQGGLSLPSRDYYFAAQFENKRAAFVEHVTKLLALAGDAPDLAAAGAKTVFAVEKALAEVSKTPTELRDRVANYNKFATTELAAKMPVFPLLTYLSERGIGGPAAAEIIVGQPKFFEGLQAQLVAL
eukprot:gene9760-12383_t